jgi:hypothetical protein
VPVVRVSAKTGAGVAELWQAVAAAPSRRPAAGDDGELLRAAQEALALRFAAGSVELRSVADQWRRGILARHEAGEAALRALVEDFKRASGIASVANAEAEGLDST